MTAIRLDGKQLANTHLAHLREQIQHVRTAGQRAPGLAIIQVGDHPPSNLYVRHKINACEHVGIHACHHHFPADISADELTSHIQANAQDDAIDGILVQLPLPPHLDSDTILSHVVPHKDVDGFHPNNAGHLLLKQPALLACTPKGILALLDTYQLPLEAQHVVMVGVSNIVGRPMGIACLNARATVTFCHSRTQHIESHLKQADILILATGRPAWLKGEHIKPGAIVIDVGITRDADNRLVGDVDQASVAPVASHLTPVPGGVGPMTIASLLENTWQAYQAHIESPI